MSNLNETIRETLMSAGKQFASVQFMKKDGTITRRVYKLDAGRKLLVNSERGEKATATRRENNPDLFDFYSVKDRGWRSCDLNRVIAVKIAGTRSEFRKVKHYLA